MGDFAKDRFEFPRKVNQELYYYLFEPFNKLYGHDEYVNNVFEYRPYDWSEPEYPAPNLYHKSSGFKLWWYKHPLRSAESNMQISSEQFWDILCDCINSLQLNIEYADVNKWWLK